MCIIVITMNIECFLGHFRVNNLLINLNLTFFGKFGIIKKCKYLFSKNDKNNKFTNLMKSQKNNVLKIFKINKTNHLVYS